MRYRPLGRTGISVSEIGFGCGSQGGLMVRGESPDRLKAVARAIELGINYFDTAPTVYNLLNPSAGRTVPSGFYAQDFGDLISHAAHHGVGVIVIRVLAAGALSGTEAHPLAGRGGPPMGTSSEFSEDVTKAER